MFRILFVFLTLGLPTSALPSQPSTAVPDLRNAYASLCAVPGVPDAFKVNFNDAAVLLRSIMV